MSDAKAKPNQFEVLLDGLTEPKEGTLWEPRYLNLVKAFLVLQESVRKENGVKVTYRSVGAAEAVLRFKAFEEMSGTISQQCGYEEFCRLQKKYALALIEQYLAAAKQPEARPDPPQ